MTRSEWLATLRTGDPVVLRTQLREYRAFVERIDGEKLWVVYALRESAESATWVKPATGEHESIGMAIYPVGAETAQEAPQGAGNGDPPPNHHPERKIDSRPVVGGSKGIGDVEATA